MKAFWFWKAANCELGAGANRKDGQVADSGNGMWKKWLSMGQDGQDGC